MEPNSAHAIITGLVGSLVITLQLLDDFETKFASTKFSDSDAHAEVSLSLKSL